MKTLVLGLGKSGMASVEYLQLQGDEVVGYDDKNGSSFPDVKAFDRVVVSPGISPLHPLYAKAALLGIEVVGEVELALRDLDQMCLAVTGTNGKTTVTLLIEHVLRCAGMEAKAVGNVGFPLTSYVKKKGEVLVLELSSFQLETIQSRKIDLGLILNITPDHLERYDSMEGYAKAKCRLQMCLKSADNLWVSGRVAKEFGWLLEKGYRVCQGDVETIGGTDYVLGEHDVENLLAAWALCEQVGVEREVFAKSLKSFTRPQHRIEFVAEKRGVFYYDDSKGTNVDATIMAVQAMKGQVVLIAGGLDKGASYVVWKKPFMGKVKHIIAIGQAAQKIEEELSPEFSVEISADLEQAVFRAAKIAGCGEMVILSPGCSSRDMFKDYADRGEQFKEFVRRL
jgi:UDP-N-acetylmuramoylalanine--D-glutamate ligase